MFEIFLDIQAKNFIKKLDSKSSQRIIKAIENSLKTQFPVMPKEYTAPAKSFLE
ncbi:MAG: hypothetical protein PHW84_14570 [Methanosarcina sp.]|jgi:mRNA interferase RelE/StbE|nr:hypothetical protein [Methanosarcina sp.]